MRRIGVLGAMKEETARLVADMRGITMAAIGGRADTQGIERADSSGTLYDRDVTVVFSRWGKVAADRPVRPARYGARPLFKQYELPIPDLGLHIISLGIEARVVQLAVASAKRYVAAVSGNAQVRAGLIVSGDRFIISSEATEGLRSEVVSSIASPLTAGVVRDLIAHIDTRGTT